MTNHEEIQKTIHINRVDGLYLRENDVEHEDYMLVEDLDEWFEQNTRSLTRADVDAMSRSGGNWRRNYSKYDVFIETQRVLAFVTD